MLYTSPYVEDWAIPVCVSDGDLAMQALVIERKENISKCLTMNITQARFNHAMEEHKISVILFISHL